MTFMKIKINSLGDSMKGLEIKTSASKTTVEMPKKQPIPKPQIVKYETTKKEINPEEN